MDLPKVEFVELKDKTREGVRDFLLSNLEEPYYPIVYLRQKYALEDEWEYIYCAVALDYDMETLAWFWDWNEGQKYVEYIAVSIITHCEQNEPSVA